MGIRVWRMSGGVRLLSAVAEVVPQLISFMRYEKEAGQKDDGG